MIMRLFIFSLIAVLAGSGSIAVAGVKKPTKSLETYLATEGEEDDGEAAASPNVAVMDEPRALSTPLPKASKQVKATEKRGSKRANPAKQKMIVKKPDSPLPSPSSEGGAVAVMDERNKFDPVPADQAESIIRRLKLVEVLIREYGRAYDYRIHTNKDLDGILAVLRHGSRQKAPSVAGDAVIKKSTEPENVPGSELVAPPPVAEAPVAGAEEQEAASQEMPDAHEPPVPVDPSSGDLLDRG